MTTETAPAAPQQPMRSLVRKLSAIMGAVERVPKSGRNEFHKYDYATEADISAAVRAGMAEKGVMMFPSVLKTEWSELATRGGKTQLCTLTVRFIVEDGDSGETREMVVIGQGTDAGDKASYKAMTGAEKYALLKLFLIPTGDDPERDDPRPPENQPRPTPPQPQPQRPVAAPPKPPAPKPQAPAPSAMDAPLRAFQEAAAKQCAVNGHTWNLTGSCDGCGALEKPAQSVELRSRCRKLWTKAHNSGVTVEAFQARAATVLGRNVPSSDWTEDDVARLEVAAVEPPERQPGQEG